MKDPRLPDTICGFEVGEDGVLSRDGMNVYPWYNKEGFIGGIVRYRLIAEDVDRKELFRTTQETQQ